MKKLKNLLLILIIVIIGVLIRSNYKLFETLKFVDPSIQANVVCKKHPGKVWLISYADGETHIANQRALTYSALNNCIDFFMHFGPHSIDKKYFEKHRGILTQPKGAGYWLWKPYIILKTLEQIPENDFVFYVDTGTRIIKPIDSLFEHLDNADILLFRNGHPNKGYVKRDLLEMLNMDNTEVLNAMQLQGGYVLVKNTKYSRNFIKKWLTICENKQALTDTPSFTKEYPSFRAHRHDQAILSLLYLQNSKKIAVIEPNETFKYLLSHHRRKTRRSLLLDHKITKVEIFLNRLIYQLGSFVKNSIYKAPNT